MAHTARVNINLPAAQSFMASHARPLDRRRLELLLDGGDPAPVLAAVDGYRNPDGGYSWGLEPDLRATESQPGGAYHAFEVFEEIAPSTSPRAVQLCDWLASVALPDGGLPFALPISDPAGCAPFWAQADPTVSSLQITAFVTGTAQRVAAHDEAVAAHPWLTRATDYCLAAIDALEDAPFAIELAAAIQFLDAVHGVRPEAAPLLERLGRHIPADGLVRVTGGAEDETMRALDFAPTPDRPVRRAVQPGGDRGRAAAPGGRAAGRRRVARRLQELLPAATLEWRGYTTVRAVSILRRN